MKTKSLVWMLMVMVWCFSCTTEKHPVDETADKEGYSAPTEITASKNRKVLDELDFSDTSDFIEAEKGLIAREDRLQVMDSNGEPVWDMDAYDFIKGDAPQSVNPSLWRQARLNDIHGLFKITENVYQLRGFDLSNMTIIQGRTGWILVDPLTSRETAERAFQFARKHLTSKPVKAIIFTHSHVDHFGGVLGIMSPEQAVQHNVQIIAPEGFMEEATSENIIAGPTMMRRASFMYGKNLARSARGHVGSGLGKGPAFGHMGILPPTDTILQEKEERVVDGVRFVFQNVPGSEAPAEFVFYLPDMKVFCGAEIVSRNMHNLYTLRGAKVRDALAWSNYIDRSLNAFEDAEIYIGTHHWPIWGNEKIRTFLKQQRDTYKYIHDQTIRLAHSGYTPREIAETLKMPASLNTVFSGRGYYGTVKHNAKAVYQRYFGWFDGNPANLDPLPPEESAKRYIECMGGAEKVLQNAQQYFDKGDYRWVAEVLNHLVFSDPKNIQAKALLAKTYDQLGYQSESGPWRDIYLTGAYELRHGRPTKGLDLSSAKELMRYAPMGRFFDAMAARLKSENSDGVALTVNVVFTDLNESYVLNIENCVLHHKKGDPDPKANGTLKVTQELYLNMALGIKGIKDTIFSDDLEVEGSKIDLIRFFTLFDQPDTYFNIVEP